MAGGRGGDLGPSLAGYTGFSIEFCTAVAVPPPCVTAKYIAEAKATHLNWPVESQFKLQQLCLSMWEDDILIEEAWVRIYNVAEKL